MAPEKGPGAADMGGGRGGKQRVNEIFGDMDFWIYQLKRLYRPIRPAVRCHSSVKPAELRGNIRFDGGIQQLLRFQPHSRKTEV